MRKTLLRSSVLVLAVALAFFSGRLMKNSGQARATKPEASTPDFSGIWFGKGIQIFKSL